MNLYKIFEHKPKIPYILGILLIGVGLFSKQIDLYLSGLFFKDDIFFLKDQKFFYIPNHIVPAVLVSVAFLFVVLWFFHKVDKQKMIFVFGSMFVGPLLITNAFFKSMWGRARPFDISNFNGEKSFSHALIPSNQCTWDCSFISGHTAVAIWTLSLALLCPLKYRNVAIFCSLLFTVIIGTTRIVQGYHFFSDVFFSGILNFYVVWFFYHSVYLKKKTGF
ncbi:MAG: phosphatase PAP2 family protein [Alphaproteobacteria bacterium]